MSLLKKLVHVHFFFDRFAINIAAPAAINMMNVVSTGNAGEVVGVVSGDVVAADGVDVAVTRA